MTKSPRFTKRSHPSLPTPSLNSLRILPAPEGFNPFGEGQHVGDPGARTGRLGCRSGDFAWRLLRNIQAKRPN